MRKLVVTEFMALDGVIQDPMWTFPYWNDEIAAFKQAELFAADAQLLGRETYVGFAEAWPPRKNNDDYSLHFNTMPKYLVSTTVKSTEWENSHIISENVAEEIAKLKEQDGKDIVVFGSGKLVQFLMQNGLVDQFNIVQYPIVVGKGQTLFGGYGSEYKLKLSSTETTSEGVLLLKYEVVK
jgi:dihydrofolate reductase